MKSNINKLFPFKLFYLAVLINLIAMLVLSLFAGIGWALLFSALLHLLLSVPYSRNWLARFVEGGDTQVRSIPINTKHGILFWIMLIIINVFVFLLAYVMFKFNVKIIDLF